MPIRDELPVQPRNQSILRVGDTVRRPTYPWSSSIHALLQHLEAEEFPLSPRFLGIDRDGHEVLTFIEGESGSSGWGRVVPESGLRSFVAVLHDYHQAVASFRPAEASWCIGTRGLSSGELVRHGDFGPWNVVWREDRPVGILDWDHARPGFALDDLAYAAEYTVPFRPDDECLRWLGYDRIPDRRERLSVMADEYDAEVEGLAERVVAVQRETLELVKSLASRGIQPQSGWVAQGHLEEIQRRIDWSRTNSELFR